MTESGDEARGAICLFRLEWIGDGGTAMEKREAFPVCGKMMNISLISGWETESGKWKGRGIPRGLF